MPKLWNTTIEAHRHEVRAAVMRTTAHLVEAHGLRGVTMSAIAEHVGIGRATLYKYFPDVDAILSEWHHEQVGRHLDHLRSLSQQSGPASERLERVLSTYGLSRYDAARRADAPEVELALHSSGLLSEHVAALRDLVSDLLADGTTEGTVRADVAPDELAVFALSSLGGAAQATSRAAVQRLIDLTLQSLRPSR